MLENKKVNINFSYVKVHSGNIGNELADENAKEAAYNGEGVSLPKTKAFISVLPTALNVNVKKFNKAQLNGGRNYDSLTGCWADLKRRRE